MNFLDSYPILKTNPIISDLDVLTSQTDPISGLIENFKSSSSLPQFISLLFFLFPQGELSAQNRGVLKFHQTYGIILYRILSEYLR